MPHRHPWGMRGNGDTPNPYDPKRKSTKQSRVVIQSQTLTLLCAVLSLSAFATFTHFFHLSSSAEDPVASLSSVDVASDIAEGLNVSMPMATQGTPEPTLDRTDSADDHKTATGAPAEMCVFPASVVVPCYKQEMIVSAALSSLFEQSCLPFEIIVVNDAGLRAEFDELRRGYERLISEQRAAQEKKLIWTQSANDTSQWGEISSLAHRYTVMAPDSNTADSPLSLRFITQENAGLAGARNTGFAAASQPWVLPLDGDDRVAPSLFLETQKALETHRREFPDAAQPNVVTADLSYSGSTENFWAPPELSTINILEQNGFHCSALIAKELWLSVGGYRVEFLLGWEDWDFFLRAHKYFVIRPLYVRQPLVIYLPGSMHSGCQQHFELCYSMLRYLNAPLYSPQSVSAAVRYLSSSPTLYKLVAGREALLQRMEQQAQQSLVASVAVGGVPQYTHWPSLKLALIAIFKSKAHVSAEADNMATVMTRGTLEQLKPHAKRVCGQLASFLLLLQLMVVNFQQRRDLVMGLAAADLSPHQNSICSMVEQAPDVGVVAVAMWKSTPPTWSKSLQWRCPSLQWTTLLCSPMDVDVFAPASVSVVIETAESTPSGPSLEAPATCIHIPVLKLSRAATQRHLLQRSIMSALKHNPGTRVILHVNTETVATSELAELIEIIDVQKHGGRLDVVPVCDEYLALAHDMRKYYDSFRSAAAASTHMQQHVHDLYRLLVLDFVGGAYMNERVVLRRSVIGLQNVLAWKQQGSTTFAGDSSRITDVFLKMRRQHPFLKGCIDAVTRVYEPKRKSSLGSSLLTDRMQCSPPDHGDEVCLTQRVRVAALPTKAFFRYGPTASSEMSLGKGFRLAMSHEDYEEEGKVSFGYYIGSLDTLKAGDSNDIVHGQSPLCRALDGACLAKPGLSCVSCQDFLQATT